MSIMKKSFFIFAISLGLSISNIYAGVATTDENGDSLKKANKERKEKTSFRKDEAALEQYMQPELKELEAMLKQFMHVTYEVPAYEATHPVKYKRNVKVYDLEGNLVYEQAAGKRPELPAGAELILSQGSTDLYVMIKKQ